MALPEREEVAAGLRKLKGEDATDKEIDLYYKALRMWHRTQGGPVPVHTMIAIILLLDEFNGEEVVKSTTASTRGKAKANA